MSLNEAREVVAQADSLWHEGKMYGVDEGDSATLAQAYERLKGLSAFSRQKSEYAHACYHYGRLLREKDDPAAAMQAFLDATHSHTKDYHILGRVYSNIGDICHLAGEFQLSYDMFERSAEMFLRNSDTLLYYYLLNDMAFELAEQGKKEEAFCIISQIEKSCTDAGVIAKTLETKAEACLYTHQYDSILYYTDLLYSNNRREPHIFLLRAQAFTYLERKDSAVYYANYVLSVSNELFNKNSALYIITQDDESKDKQDIRMTSAERSDIQKLIEIRQGKLSQAVQLLEQDLARKPDYQWIYAIIGVILFACSCAILYYIWRKRKEHSRILHEIDIKQEQKTQLETNIVAMHSEISQLSEQQQKTHQHLLSNIEAACSTLRNSKDVLSELCWKDYTQMCAITNNLFNKLADSLQEKGLSEREVRLCILVLINCYSDKQMANILLYGENSIRGTKRYVARKLGTSSANMRIYLMELIARTT